jgi:serpin B
MVFSSMNSVLSRLRQIVGPETGADAGDSELLAAYNGGDVEAFEQLVRRHGRLVLAVCRRMLGNEHDADDAFQATFMILARKAGSLRVQTNLSSWLYSVACRTADKARRGAARRRRREEVVATMTREETSASTDDNSVRVVLDEEVNRLPEKYRLPVLLCYLEGISGEEAARRLCCSLSAVKMRLSRARELLRARLGRRGVAISAITLGTFLEDQVASAAMPAPLLTTTIQAAEAFAANPANSATGAAALAQGVIRDMSLAKLKLAALVVLTLGILGVGVSLALPGRPAIEATPNAEADVAKAVEVKPVAERDDGPVDKLSAAARSNRLGFELLGKVAAPDTNAFLSPYSISAALSMTYAGARGDTADEIASTLHFAPDQDRWHPAFGALQASLRPNGAKPAYELHVANRLWGHKTTTFHEPFLKTTREHYGAGIEPVDFEDTEAARKTINTWVEKQTKDKIQELLKKGDLTRLTRLVLTNAIYFNSAWQYPFFPEFTKDEAFHRPGGEALKVPMMRTAEVFGYAAGEGFEAVSIPYKDRALSMVIVLPKKRDGLEAVEKWMTGARLQEVVQNMKQERVDLTLPKFKLLERYALNEVLAEMGMKKSFRPEADFSGICSEKPLFIAKVIHQAMVSVDEKGTEAAAATAVVMDSGAPPPKAIPVKVDHPFLFLIRENKTGAVLFLGRLVNPAAK